MSTTDGKGRWLNMTVFSGGRFFLTLGRANANSNGERVIRCDGAKRSPSTCPCSDVPVIRVRPLPHGVEERPFLCDAEQLVGHGHVVGHRLLAVVKERVRGPDLAGHQVVQTEDSHGPFKLEPLVDPALPKEHVDGVLLRVGEKMVKGGGVWGGRQMSVPEGGFVDLSLPDL